MTCPICNNENLKKDYCENCKIDVKIVNNMFKRSNAFFNDGLQKANQSNISGAIDSFKKSLYYNKKNYLSRNILGLIYFDIGEFPEAKKQWDLSISIQKDDNLAKQYLEDLSSNNIKMIKLKESVQMYNQALIYLEQKSEDMAIIQLKKAIDSNPKFLKAYNLLTLCYLAVKDEKKAFETIDKTLEQDYMNEKALEYGFSYGHHVNSEKGENISGNRKGTLSTFSSVLSQPEQSFFSVWGIRMLVALGAGIAIGFILVYFILVPPMVLKNTEITNLKEEEIVLMEAKITALENEQSVLANDFTTAKNTLEAENKELEEKVSLQDKIQNVHNAEQLINEGNNEEAALLLSKLNESELPDELVDKYNLLVERSFTKTANVLYSRAITKYNERKYEEARQSFEECLIYAEPTSQTAGDTKFFLGEIAAALEDNEKAISYYNTVVDEFPNSRYNWTARNRLTRLNQE